jgi:hypothetical protein
MAQRKEDVVERIRDMVNSLGWDDLVDKTKTIMLNAQKNLNQSTKESFDDNKGYFRCAQLFYRLIVEDPKAIADKGIVKTGGKV